MESQQVNSEPVVQTATPAVKKGGNKVLTAILAIVALGGLGFAGFEFWQGMQKDTEITDLKVKLSDAQKPAVEPDKGEAISVKEADKILAKYIGEENNVLAYLGSYYHTFASDFDDTQRAYLAYSGVADEEKKDIECVDEWYEKGMCTEKSINYDVLNEKYTALFGDYSSLKKENYSFLGFFYLVYDEEIDGYREYILPGGGTTPIRAIHKTISVERDGENMVANLVFAELDTSAFIPEGISGPVNVSGSILDADKKIDDMVESMAIYKFTLSPYEGSYVLTKVEKE